MHTTHHCKVRQSQRGITPSMVDYVLIHGSNLTQDRVVFGKKEAQRRLAEIEAERRLLMRITDKGGVVVIQEGDALITTYNYSSHH